MILIVCIDDEGGLLFNHRRVSRDTALMEEMGSYVGERLWIQPFSEKLVKEMGLPYRVSEKLLTEAQRGDYCFVENLALEPYRDQIEQLIVYHWNRKYPSDFKIDLSLRDFTLLSTTEFKGKAHEKITKEIYQ